MNHQKKVLVTVGTTGFDQLIMSICSESFVKELHQFGYSSIIIQYGSSKQFYNPFYFEKYKVLTDFCYADRHHSVAYIASSYRLKQMLLTIVHL